MRLLVEECLRLGEAVERYEWRPTTWPGVRSFFLMRPDMVTVKVAGEGNSTVKDNIRNL